VTRPSVYTIPPHRSFADALVAGLMAREGRDRMTLARGLVLVPNNRAARAIQDAFVRRAEGGLLLPRLVPIGDPELDDRIGAFLDPIDAEPIPPAVDPLQRQLILARLIEESGGATGAEAMRLAGELARTLDQLHVEGVAPQRLREIDVGELTEHWARSLKVFELVLDRWPKELARLGRIDLTDRRNRLLGRVAKRWRESPPPGFVVAAGISTTAPAVAAVLRTVAFMPSGRVVFDALDTGMPEAQWAALGPHRPDPETGVAERPVETHPQYHLKLLLDRLGVARGEVERWSGGGGDAARAGRSGLGWSALGADAWRQPRIGRRQRRPGPFVQSGEDRQIRLLQPRLDQAANEHAVMPPLRRPHRDSGHQIGQHRAERIRIDPRRPLGRVLL
jgi:ATP-dependent helicase/nuclease subunit B